MQHERACSKRAVITSRPLATVDAFMQVARQCHCGLAFMAQVAGKRAYEEARWPLQFVANHAGPFDQRAQLAKGDFSRQIFHAAIRG
jgi:hypothetical protein